MARSVNPCARRAGTRKSKLRAVDARRRPRRHAQRQRMPMAKEMTEQQLDSTFGTQFESSEQPDHDQPSVTLKVRDYPCDCSATQKPGESLWRAEFNPNCAQP